jgi:hypothetical protein
MKYNSTSEINFKEELNQNKIEKFNERKYEKLKIKERCWETVDFTWNKNS